MRLTTLVTAFAFGALLFMGLFALLALGGCSDMTSRDQQLIDSMRPAIFAPGSEEMP